MKKNIIYFFKLIFPFLTVLFLWNLSVNFWNPAGILAIIPIFYCSFVKPVPFFPIYSLLFCFLIDYKFDTLVFWTCLYCVFYSANGFQPYIDLRQIENNAFVFFMLFFGLAMIILFLANISLSSLFTACWLFVWVSLLYLPITTLIKKVCNDR